MLGVTFTAAVTRCLDGDTIEVELKRTVRVRLLDCWAPETRTKDAEQKVKGLAAKEFIQELLPPGTLVDVVVPMEADARFGEAMSMGRVLGHVLAEGCSVADMVVRAGHATTTKEG